MRKVICLIGFILLSWAIHGCGNSDSGTEPSGTPDHTISIELTPGGVEMEFVWIESGTYTMGANIPDWNRDSQYHEVKITEGFYIGKYEITVAQWEALMGSLLDEDSSGEDSLNPNLPINNVTRTNIWAFCRAFEESIGAEYPTFSLPTEAQWEYACRAGTDTPWFFGEEEDRLDDFAWYQGNSDRRPHPVGTKLPNPWGLYDMHGNVSEFIRDHYSWEFYTVSPLEDPWSFSGGVHRIYSNGLFYGFRGGSFDQNAKFLQSGIRFKSIKSNYNKGIGARIIKQ
jgi:formylglycine-generating enzyme required for sulfatase activity